MIFFLENISLFIKIPILYISESKKAEKWLKFPLL